MISRDLTLVLCLLVGRAVLAQTAPSEPEAGAAVGSPSPPVPEAEPAAGAVTPTAPEQARTEAPPAPETAAVGEAPPVPSPSPEPDAPPVITVTKKGMGTRLQIQVFAGDAKREDAQRAIEAAFAEMKRLEGLLSEWAPDSEISKINRNAGTGEAIPVSPEVLITLKRGKEISALSKGAFAMTWAVLSSIWDFRQGDAEVKKVPDPVRAQQKTDLIDDTKLLLDEVNETAKLETKEMALGMGAIAKGFAIDRALAVLVQKGFANALVFAGGDIGVTGAKGDKPWLIGIQDPRADGYFATIAVRDEAVVTSGDYERYFEVGDQRYHHILDPRTGYPAQGIRSVTIVAKDVMSADAFATAVFVLGPQAGMKLVEEQEGVEAVIVDAENNISISTNLRNRVRVLRAPTG